MLKAALVVAVMLVVTAAVIELRVRRGTAPTAFTRRRAWWVVTVHVVRGALAVLRIVVVILAFLAALVVPSWRTTKAQRRVARDRGVRMTGNRWVDANRIAKALNAPRWRVGQRAPGR